MPSQGKKHSEMFRDGLNEEVAGSTPISQCPAAQMYRKTHQKWSKEENINFYKLRKITNS